MELGEGIKMGDSPELCNPSIMLGARVIPRKRETKEAQILEALNKIRAVLEHIDGQLTYLTRPSFWQRLLGRIKSWVA